MYINKSQILLPARTFILRSGKLIDYQRANMAMVHHLFFKKISGGGLTVSNLLRKLDTHLFEEVPITGIGLNLLTGKKPIFQDKKAEEKEKIKDALRFILQEKHDYNDETLFTNLLSVLTDDYPYAKALTLVRLTDCNPSNRVNYLEQINELLISNNHWNGEEPVTLLAFVSKYSVQLKKHRGIIKLNN